MNNSPLNNLATKNTSDFTVLNNGDAFISQTKVAVLCGVGQNSISQFITKTRDTLQLNDNSQLGHNSLELVIGHYAFDSQRTNEITLGNYRMLAKAGAKAYIYHEAGYIMEAKPKLPENYIEALGALIESEKAKEIEQRKVAALTTIVDNEFGYSSIIRAAQHLGIHEKSFNWRRLKAETLLLGMEVKNVPSPRFKYQLLYPIRAFENCYPQYDFMDLLPEKILNDVSNQIEQAADNHISGAA